MLKYKENASAPHSRDAFRRIVDQAYEASEQPLATEKEIDEAYSFYRLLFDEDGGIGELSFEKVDGKVVPAFGCP